MLHPGQHVHIVGVGGFGMSAIARVLLQRGFVVSGSDQRANDLMRNLAALGVGIMVGHAPENVAGADIVVISSAIPGDNPEIVAATTAGIQVVRRRDMLGALMDGYTGIAVAGTHGKTTTSALMTHVLMQAGRDPTYIVGGVMQNTGTNAGVGQGNYFVIEADEYDHMFLGLKPEIAIVTNIEHDHPDCYPTSDDVVQAFGEFVEHVPAHGLLVACSDNAPASRLAGQQRSTGKTVVLYGLEASSQPDWTAAQLEPDSQGGISFTAVQRGQAIGRVRLNLPGAHNVQNALAVLAVATQQGIPFAAIVPAFESFQGTERRSQMMGEAGGVTVINDYAHHPTAIRVTLAAHRTRPGLHHLWAVWQPHTFQRMRTMAEAFAQAFSAADHVLVTDVYSVREQVGPGLDAAGMADLISDTGHVDARYTGTLETTADVLIKAVQPGDVVLLLSAGDAPLIGELLLRARG